MSEPRDSLQQTCRQVRRRKACLSALLVLTTVVPLGFLSLDEPTGSLQFYKLLAKTGSLAGTMLLVWQMLLGRVACLLRQACDDRLFADKAGKLVSSLCRKRHGAVLS